MSEPLPDPAPVNDALRKMHRSALVSVAVCAVVIGALGLSGVEPQQEDAARLYSFGALALAAVAILARRSVAGRTPQLRRFVYASVLSMLACVGLGLLGFAVAYREGEVATGLLYVLAGALLLLRPPPRLVLGTRPDPGAE